MTEYPTDLVPPLAESEAVKAALLGYQRRPDSVRVESDRRDWLSGRQRADGEQSPAVSSAERLGEALDRRQRDVHRAASHGRGPHQILRAGARDQAHGRPAHDTTSTRHPSRVQTMRRP